MGRHAREVLHGHGGLVEREVEAREEEKRRTKKEGRKKFRSN
jgi:hypothetical protein